MHGKYSVQIGSAVWHSCRRCGPKR